jgi:Uma2 family endonuclease
MMIATAPSLDRQLLLNVANTTLSVTPEQFDLLCIDNPDLRLELTRNQELIVMAPTGGESGERNSDLLIQVGIWNRHTKPGRVFDSSTGYDFTPIGGGKISPDVSWIERSRLEGVDIKGFIPVVPDFVIELRSATDRLNALKTKMLEYQRLGVRLGLLINPQEKTVEIYRFEQEPEILNNPSAVNCDDILPGFILNMTEIW